MADASLFGINQGMTHLTLSLSAALLLACHAPSFAQQVELGGRPVLQTVDSLKPGQFVWNPEAAPEGPALLVVNLATQRAVLFRNGVPIGASTVSTGKPGYETPTGVLFVVDQAVEDMLSPATKVAVGFRSRGLALIDV